MKYSQFFIQTLRETPSDAVIASHRLMLRSGMMRKLANGLFAYMPLGLRAFRKVEAIVRQEMAAAGSLEIKPTVVVPAGLWKESGRWHTMGDSMLRVTNRLNDEFVVSPTAEEAAVALIRETLSSYKQLPVSVFQINTKFRDEIRPRYGVMRAREFIMKDAYSFHSGEECLDTYYKRMGSAYRRVFARCGLDVIVVKADSGAMGGEGSEEFMVESAIGDNTLLLCKQCGRAANVEKAACRDDFTVPAESGGGAGGVAHISKIDTPNVKTIAELCAFLKMDAKRFIKTLIYRAVNVELDINGMAHNDGGWAFKSENRGGGLVYPEIFAAVCIRGDLDVNEVKLCALLKASEVSLASDADVVRITGAPVGFAGPAGLRGVPLIADRTIPGIHAGVCGALEADKHCINVEYGRDYTAVITADVRTAQAGDRCADCGGELYEKKGNELGHIFKLGSKYTKSMNVTYLDENGTAQIPLMGTYGIGIDRTLASVIEEHHDDAGIVWPVSVAPFHVHIIPIKYDGEVQAACDVLEAGLAQAGIETLLDDRDERAGIKFNDADLIGIPYRITVGDRNLKNSPPLVELKLRGAQGARTIPLAGAAAEVAALVQNDIAGTLEAARRAE
ncbi:MAG: proline--tRNA ligase [Spirochaetaceae bacterium]|jgi:prolyl-tRNA synthetase|nr:proline--tRNA ligase [Spirochaetaceae bacterium]